MKKSLRNLEDELANALEAVNDAEIVVEAATKNVKVASASVVKLQKEAYKAVRSFKDASGAFVKASKKGNATDEKHKDANTALAAVKALQKEAYRAERTFKDAGEALARALKKANAANGAFEVAKKALAAARKKTREEHRDGVQ